MSEVFPVIIGITGKRKFSDEPQIAEALEITVRERLKAVFDYIDEFLPLTPKILLTGAAAGADLMAAEEVLGLTNGPGKSKIRQNWLVVAALPFEQRLWEQDFTPDQWARYIRVVEDMRTRTSVLPPLNFAAGQQFTAADLERRAYPTEGQKEIRRWHYEQVGLWITDTANILLAVMPSHEGAGKTGGTARIVACRRSARPDPAATKIIAASRVLVPRTELYRAPNGYAWLIDPAAEPLCAVPPVTVLQPAPDNTPWSTVYRAPANPDWPNTADNDSPRKRPSQIEHLEESETVLKIARSYVRDNHNGAPPATEQKLSLQTWPKAESRAQLLTLISNKLRDPTNKAADEYRRTIYRLISYFVLAVLAFEIFAKFLPEKPHILSAYLILLGLAMVSYLRAGQRELQPIAEDRRAIREALRVQIAWWQCGLDDRVDFVYLKGADHDLSRVREATRNVIVYALLACGSAPEAQNWKAVLDHESWPPFSPNMPAAKFPRDWIGNQCFYFRQRKTQRHRRGEFIESMSWALFSTAVCLALLLLAWLVSDEANGHLTKLLLIVDSTFPYWVTMLATLAMVAAAAGCWWLDTKLVSASRTKWKGLPLMIAISLPAALFLFVAAQLAATIVNHRNEPLWTFGFFLLPIIGYITFFAWKIIPDANGTHPAASILGVAATILLSIALLATAALFGRHFESSNKAEEITLIARSMIIVMVIFIPALTGAMRFLSEKLAIEAEALSYRDAHVWFEHATNLLSEQPPGCGNAKADERAKDIVRRLGVFAVYESEAWLKLRRERPLSPVI